MAAPSHFLPELFQHFSCFLYVLTGLVTSSDSYGHSIGEWRARLHSFIRASVNSVSGRKSEKTKQKQNKKHGRLLGPPPPSAQAPGGLSVRTVPFKFLGFTGSKRFLWFPDVFWEFAHFTQTLELGWEGSVS